MNTLRALAEWMAPRAKAVVAGVGAVVLLLLGLLPDGLTVEEWTLLITTALAQGGIVYAVPNAAAKTAAVRASRNGTQP